MPNPSGNESPAPDQSVESGAAAAAGRTCAELIGSMKDSVTVCGDVMSTGIFWEAEEDSLTAA
jgi:hypothetical protein